MKTKQDSAPGKDKNALLKSLAGSVLLVALGVLLLLRPDFATATVAAVLGWILIGGGAILIAVAILNWDVTGVPELVFGIVAAAAGIFIVIRPNFLASAFGIIIGLYLGFQAISTLITALKLKESGYVFVPTLVLGLVLLALALVLILVPMSLSRLLVRIVGLLMALSGLSHLVLRSRFFMSLPRQDPKIVDAAPNE
jgi:uncharacterized membrane protein HdeD (DUF308 family)